MIDVRRKQPGCPVPPSSEKHIHVRALPHSEWAISPSKLNAPNRADDQVRTGPTTLARSHATTNITSTFD